MQLNSTFAAKNLGGLRLVLGVALLILCLGPMLHTLGKGGLNLSLGNLASPQKNPPSAALAPVLAAQPQDATPSYTYYLPMIAHNYVTDGAPHGYTTYLSFQNLGTASAAITLQYFDQLGNAVQPPSDTCKSVALNGECIAPNPFRDGITGTGILTSSQPLNVLVAEDSPFGGSAYVVPSGANNSEIAPLAFNRYLGEFSTQLTVFNGGTAATPVTVQYYGEDGRLVKTDTQTIGSHLAINLSQEDTRLSLPWGFNGWAQVSSPSGSQLVVQELEHHHDNGFVTVVNAVNQPQTTLYAPAIMNNVFGFTTGANIVNPSSTPVSVTVTYYRHDGRVINTAPFTLGAYSSQGIYHGEDAVDKGLPGNGDLDFFDGAAKVTSTGNGVVMVVNEDGGYNDFGRRKSGTYSAVASGSTTVGLPAVANRGFGYVTGVTIFNTSSSVVSGTIQYYDLDGSTEGQPRSFTVGPYSSVLQYQGDPAIGLPDGSIPNHDPFFGTAVISESSNTNAGLIATVNAVSDNFFYTYAEPTQ